MTVTLSTHEGVPIALELPRLVTLDIVDVNVGEPGALIGFAGPRVIEQTIRQKLPEGFQRSEFLLKHGMLDAVVARPELKTYISKALTFFCGPVQ